MVYLAQPAGLPDEARVLGEAIRVYFARQAQTARRKLKHRLKLGWITLIVGLILLVASVTVGQWVARRFGQGPLATVLRESLLIGGWVAMWRPMDFFLFELWATRGDLKVYECLSKTTVRIVYEGANGTAARPVQTAATAQSA